MSLCEGNVQCYLSESCAVGYNMEGRDAIS